MSARAPRLRAFFNAAIRGEKPVGSQGAMFLEALCDQTDAPQCIATVIACSHGLSSVRDAICSDISLNHLNGPVADFLRYIEAPGVKTLASSTYLHRVLIAIVDPPTFWSRFIEVFEQGQLSQDAELCFAWLLHELLLLPEEASDPYRTVAEKSQISDRLIQSKQSDIRSHGHKIKSILSTTSTSAAGIDSGFQPGGRHDNDYADFRHIAILPTADEISSNERPFYRTSQCIYDPLTEDTRVATYLDNQFRLLREDMLSEMREELQKIKGPNKGKGHRALVVDGLDLVDVHFGPDRKRSLIGLQFQCRSDLPQLQQERNFVKRVKYLQDDFHGKKLLKHQALCCLLIDGEVGAFASIHRDEELLAKEKPNVVAQIQGSDALAKILMRIKFAKDVKLVTMDTAVFSYEPVLRGLQQMKNLPLRQELLFWKDDQMVNQVQLTYNLDRIVRALRRDPRQDLKSSLNLSTTIKLDGAQSASLVSGLTQSVSLIQGPPGTGKSFIGALLAKSIHDHSEDKILVVCYTNHALDQFLDDLIKIGIPKESLVRLGGKFNADMEAISLRAQPKMSKIGKADYKIIDDLKAEAEVHIQSLTTGFIQYHSMTLDYDELLAHVEFTESEQTFFQAFKVPASSDGMDVVGKKGRKVDEFYLMDRWIKGQDAGVYKRHPHIADYASVWQMSRPSRQTKVESWQSSILEFQVQEFASTAERYNKCQQKRQRVFEERNVDVLRSKRIIGCTTTGAAIYKESIQAAGPDVLLVEEAGEILESHIITALGSEAKQMILIGDHKQLRPKVNNYTLTVEKGEGYDLNRSLFERLVLNGYPHETLVAQHRMRPEISALIRHLTYPDLQDAPKTLIRPDLRGAASNIIFIDHTHPEDNNNQFADRRDMGSKSSKQNTFEVEMVLKIVRYLIQQGYKSEELVVLTPYLGQLQKLQAALRAETDPVLNDLDLNELIRAGLTPPNSTKKLKLRLATIDNYQGEESDVVVASLCRSNPDNDIGFMFAPERLNVLLSRARNSLIMIGNSSTFINARKGKELWQRLMVLIRNGGWVYDGFPAICSRHPSQAPILKTPSDFSVQCPDGGCSSPCGVDLPCGKHKCLMKCHPSMSVPHSQVCCGQIVEDNCPKSHVQKRKCHEPQSACRRCEKDAKELQAQLRREYEADRKRQAQQQEHERRLKELEEKIAAENEKVKDEDLARQRAQTLRQKQEALKSAEQRATDAKTSTSAFISSLFSPFVSSINPGSSTQSTGNTAPSTTGSSSNAPTPASPNAQPGTVPNLPGQPRPVTPPGNPATSNKSSPEAEWQRQKDVEGASSLPIDTIMDLVGLEDVKRQMLRIKDKVEITERQGTSLAGERFNISLLGNPGTGKTTVARQYSKFLTSRKVVSGQAFEETTGSKLAFEGVGGAINLLDKATNAGGGAIFIDEAYQLTSHNGGKQVLDYLLAEMENRVGTLVFIFAGYSKQMEKFFEHNPGLPSRVPYTMKFADYNDDELLKMLVRSIRKKFRGQMRVEYGAEGLYSRVAIKRLGRGRGREGFGNARALEVLFSKITERQAERIKREERAGKIGVDAFLLTKDDVIEPDPSQAIQSSSAWVELQKLIGLQRVKDSVKSLIDMISMNYRRELEEKEPLMVTLNRVFLGSPGTGKTTVAKLYGQVLADIGMLSNGEVILKNPADFMGSVIGASEENTKAILANSVGKVLVIDEAYMLYSKKSSHAGGGSNTFQTAIIDTIVAEVQNVPGDDRCVLLLGYEKQMREMFQNVNPGLSRRFAIEDGFVFDDFSDSELRLILDGKLKKQQLSATDAAKNVAMELLSRERNRPNFGNGGAIENLLTNSKSRYMARIRGSASSADVVFQPEDFDPEHDRHLHAEKNLKKLFEDIVGCDEVIGKLEGYQKICRTKKARNEDPRDFIPTTFLFTGPPGTGKTTVARKVGQVFFDMGFLSSNKVEECSASDLVGQYVSHTGPKTQQLFEKAIGQVLFIDEAYRLGEGRFAQEAIDEIVGMLTQKTYKGKIVVILAGYEQDIRRLLNVNSGLASRFPEQITFKNFPPEKCIEILDWKLRKSKIRVDGISSSNTNAKEYQTLLCAIGDMCSLSSFGNARDMETLARQIGGRAFQLASDSTPSSEVTLSFSEAMKIVLDMLDKNGQQSNLPKTSRSHYDDMLADISASSAPPPPPATGTNAAQSGKPSPPPPPPSGSNQPPNSTPDASFSKAKGHKKQPSTSGPVPNAAAPRPSSKPANQTASAEQGSDVQRDPGVTDQVWQQLEEAKKKAAEETRKKEEEIKKAQQKMRQAIKDEENRRAQLRAAAQAEQAAKDASARELAKKQREEFERKERAAKAAKERMVRELNRKKEEEKKRKEEEQRIQTKLRNMGVCPMGYRWIRQTYGWRCAGGSHYVSDNLLK